MIVKRLATGIKNQDWFVVMVEVMIVVVGIFIGLQVDDWNDSRKDRIEENAYLKELLEDFEANQLELSDSTNSFEDIIKSMISLLRQSSKEEPDQSITQLNLHFSKIHSMPTFISVKRIYSNLTGSGELKLLQNRELKNELAQYYAAADLAVLVQSTHEMELVQTFQPYVIENMDFQAVYLQRIDDFTLPPSIDVNRILKVLHTREFRNILTQKWTISTDLLDQHRTLQLQTDQIINMLEKELGEEARRKEK